MSICDECQLDCDSCDTGEDYPVLTESWPQWITSLWILALLCMWVGGWISWQQEQDLAKECDAHSNYAIPSDIIHLAQDGRWYGEVRTLDPDGKTCRIQAICSDGLWTVHCFQRVRTVTETVEKTEELFESCTTCPPGELCRCDVVTGTVEITMERIDPDHPGWDAIGQGG